MKIANEDALVEAAWQVRSRAYAPYSGFRVGAAVLMASGKVYVGANVENASYPVGICAERSALAAAASAGERHLEAIALVADTDRVVGPCGMCRQTIREFGTDVAVVVSIRNDARTRFSIEDLLPSSFGPEALGHVTGED